MNIKQIHDAQIEKIFSKARALDKDTKIELIAYLESAITLMEQDLQDQEPNWANLEYLKGEQARNFFESELNGYTIGWKCDEREIIDFDKQVISELKKGL